MLLSPIQISDLLAIIENYNVLFVGENVGFDILSERDIQLLRSLGVNVDTETISVFEQAFRFGMLSSTIGLKEAKSMTYEDLQSALESGRFIPLTDVEKYALDSVRRQAYSDIRGLGNKMTKDLENILIEEDRAGRLEYENAIRESAETTIKLRESARDMVSRLGHKTLDWNRDFARISDYVLHTAFDEGRAAQIRKEFGDEAEVYKDVYPGACKHCIRLYLTNGLGSMPIVYKVSDLIANGSNIGRKSFEWKPVVGATHPWCRCTLTHKPADYDWDEETKRFNKPKPFKRRVQRNSRVTITIGDNVIEV